MSSSGGGGGGPPKAPESKKGEVNELLTLLRAANSPANTDKTGKRKRDVLKKVRVSAFPPPRGR